MKTNNKGKKLIKEFESLHLEVYLCPAGVKTVGYGHTGVSVNAMNIGDKITHDKADQYLEIDISNAEKQVNKYHNKYKFNENQYSALVSFAFNIGTIDTLTANGTRSIETISKKILEYCNVNHKPVEGLVRRRKAEKELFDEVPMENTSNNIEVFEVNYHKYKNENITKNFKFIENIAKGNLRTMYENGKYQTMKYCPLLFGIAQLIVDKYGSMKVNSGYAPWEYYKTISKASYSKHSLGLAIDLSPVNPKTNIKDIIKWLDSTEMKNIGGLGYYKGYNMLHMDLDQRVARWIQPGESNTYKVVDSLTPYLL